MKKSTVTLLIIILLVIVGGTIYFFKDTISQMISRPAVEEERKVWQDKTQKLEQEIEILEDEIKKDQLEVPEGKLEEVFGDVPSNDEELSSEEAKAEVQKFFSYLDQKAYLAAYGFNEDAYEHFEKMVQQLESSKPIITGETQDLYTLLKNITFFYRILGENNIKLVKDILSAESEIIEPTLKLFFVWMNPWQAGEDDRIGLSKEAMYEYASFLLNTISGQSYLMRRDATIRTLAQYYGVVILDHSNDDVLNKYGIDIRPHIDSLIDEITSHKRLIDQRKYLSRLHAIRAKY